MFQVFFPYSNITFFPNKSPSCFSTPLNSLDTSGNCCDLYHPQTSALAVPAKRQSGPTPVDVGEVKHLVFVVSFWGGTKRLNFFYIRFKVGPPITHFVKWSEITARSTVILFTPGKTQLFTAIYYKGLFHSMSANYCSRNPPLVRPTFVETFQVL